VHREKEYRLEGANLLAQELPKMRNLKILDLFDRYLGPEGARDLAPVLKRMQSIRNLYLLQNHMDVEGAQVIAQALYQHTDISDILLGSSIHEVKEARAVVALCKQNKRFLEKATLVFQLLCFNPDGPKLHVYFVNKILNFAFKSFTFSNQKFHLF
jgi:Ran GTPase-activating protein (RanGAP) involved in mRNA processing and transport